MKDLLVVLLVGLIAVAGYHTATYGRRGRRWGRFEEATPPGATYSSCAAARCASSDPRCREPASCAGRGGGAAPWEAPRESESRRWPWAVRVPAVAARRLPRPRRGSPLRAAAEQPADGTRCPGIRPGRALRPPGCAPGLCPAHSSATR